MFDSNDITAIVQHMNEDHADAVLSYVRAFSDIEKIDSTRMTSIDKLGIDIECGSGGERLAVRVLFPTALQSADEARTALVNLVKNARSIEAIRISDYGAYAPIDCQAYDYIEIACTYQYWLNVTLKEGYELVGRAKTTRIIKDQGEFLELDISGKIIKLRLDSIDKITVLDKNPKFDTQAIA